MLYNKEYKKEDFEIKIDWKYLTKDGLREAREKTEIFIGFGLGTLISFYIGLSFVYKIWGVIENGNSFELEFTKFFWILVLVWCFCLYLLRDRNTFLDVYKANNIPSIVKREIKKVDLAYITDRDLLFMLDKLIKSSKHKYFVNKWLVLEMLFTKKDVLTIISRLNLSIDDFDLSNKTAKDINLDDLMKEAYIYAINLHLEYIDETALFMALMSSDEDMKNILFSLKIVDDSWDSLKLWIKNENAIKQFQKIWEFKKAFKPDFKYNRGFTNVSIPELEMFSRDVTLAVKQSKKFSLSLSRDKEIDDLTSLLGKDNTNVLLVGEPGVGKTTLLESLAVMMVVEQVPEYLKDKRLVEFNFNKAYLKTKSLKEYIDIFHSVLEGLEKAGNIVLVLDNFEQLLNTKKELSAEISNFIISIAENKNLHLIATTTNEGYQKYIKSNLALDKLFSKVEMSEPTKYICQQIIADESKKLEKEHGVKIKIDAVTKAYDLSEKYPSERVLPDKALDLIREAISSLESGKGKIREIDAIKISQVLSDKLGVKVGTVDDDEAKKLKDLEIEMKKRVVGQEKAINAVASAMRRERYGLRDETKPIASFLFAGPTGVGKTEVARTFAKIWFGSSENMIRLDMSEYQEDSNLARLIGFVDSSGDYIEGYLTEAVRKKPFSLLLLDEIEKASPKVLDLFLQVLDEGRLKDGLSRDTDFKNCVIIATSNIGSGKITELKEDSKFSEVEKIVKSEIEAHFRIEFLNRFDEIIVFRPLKYEDALKIVNILLQLKKEELRKKGISIEITNELVERITKKGYSDMWGARELKRALDREIENIVY